MLVWEEPLSCRGSGSPGAMKATAAREGVQEIASRMTPAEATIFLQLIALWHCWN